MAKIVFVNPIKEKEARTIVNHLTGDKKFGAEQEYEMSQAINFAQMMEEAKVDIKKKPEEAVEFVYEKLGGLIRTEAEQSEAEKKKEELANKNGNKGKKAKPEPIEDEEEEDKESPQGDESNE